MHDVIETLVPALAITMTFGIPGIIIFWAIHVKHKERMKLIEKGLTPEEVKSYYHELGKRVKYPYSSLKWGIIFTAVGIGFLFSFLLNEYSDVSESITPAFILVFAGIGFIIYYVIINKKLRNDASKIGNGKQAEVVAPNN